MARYIMEEMPDLRKTGKRITYPKFARIDNASIKELAQRVGGLMPALCFHYTKSFSKNQQ